MRLFVGTFVLVEGFDRLKAVVLPLMEGRWVPEANLHLTLRFLGEVPDAKEVIDTLEPLVYRRGEAITFDRLGMFGQKILYAASDDPILYETSLAVDSLLGKRHARDKAFIPHVTLMKINMLHDPERALPEFPKGAAIGGQLQVALIKSELTKAGPVYRVIKEF